MKSLVLALVGAIVLVAAGGCQSVRTTSAGAVGVDRKQQMLVSSEAIEEGAAEAYQTELKTARDKDIERNLPRVLPLYNAAHR